VSYKRNNIKGVWSYKRYVRARACPTSY